MNNTLERFINTCHARLDKIFFEYLKNKTAPAKNLQEAMFYAVANGGKRMRPLLVYATGSALDVPIDVLDAPAAAIEIMHSYSLIHDDLPAMDNADLRRGKLTCHKAFSESTAILAGDALQTLAFEILATHAATLSAEQRILMIQTLAHASGMEGMASGQALDMQGVTDLESATTMYSLKTGALIIASVKLAMIPSPNVNKVFLINYAKSLGLAFQLQDDLLDVENAEVTGKSQNLDLQNNKITFPTLLGIPETHKKIQALYLSALNALEPFGEKANDLRDLTEFLFQRKK